MPSHTIDYTNLHIVPWRNRDVHSAAIVFVYRNLHKDMWSLIANDGPHKGFVVGHASHIVLDYARWRVNETGRQRVIADRQKNVHAGVFGTLADTEPVDVAWQQVAYNPYKSGHFYLPDLLPEWSRVDSTRYAMFDITGKAWFA